MGPSIELTFPQQSPFEKSLSLNPFGCRFCGVLFAKHGTRQRGLGCLKARGTGGQDHEAGGACEKKGEFLKRAPYRMHRRHVESPSKPLLPPGTRRAPLL